MKIRQNIPNFLTCCNLLCGCLAIVQIYNHNLVMASILVGIAAVFDFFDGFAARLLKVSSPIGKDLDSLADMTTFGFVPGMMVFSLMHLGNKDQIKVNQGWHTVIYGDRNQDYFYFFLMNVVPFLITVFSAIRLAKFNNDTRQTESFIGLPTPANAIVICSLPLILAFECNYVRLNYFFTTVDPMKMNTADPGLGNAITNPFNLAILSILMSFLLVAELPLFALKFKSFGWKGNEIRYIFLGLSLVLLITLKFIGIPLVIILYILLSVVNNLLKKNSPPSSGREGGLN